MKVVTLFTCMAAALLVGCQSQSISLADGHRMKASQWKNQWVIVTYWADWCEQCKKEVPALNAYVATHPRHVIVLGVNFDGLQGVKLHKAVKAMKIHFPVIDGKSPFKLPRPDVLPVTYLLDKHKHQVIKTWVGPQFLQWLKKSSAKLAKG